MKANSYLIAIIMIVGLLSASNASAQQAINSSEPVFQVGTAQEPALKSFSASLNSKKVYVRWTATDATGECVYIVERSADGATYQKIGAKKGAVSPGSTPLLFSFIDDQPQHGTTFYRVQQVSADGITMSQAIQIKNEENEGVAINK